MYRIMIAQAKRDNYETLYKYLTTNIDGEVIPLELGSKEALDKRVEKMLNEEGYAKSDFIIVRVVDYTIDATAYTNTDADTDTSDIDVTLLRAEKSYVRNCECVYKYRQIGKSNQSAFFFFSKERGGLSPTP